MLRKVPEERRSQGSAHKIVVEKEKVLEKSFCNPSAIWGIFFKLSLRKRGLRISGLNWLEITNSKYGLMPTISDWKFWLAIIF